MDVQEGLRPETEAAELFSAAFAEHLDLVARVQLELRQPFEAFAAAARTTLESGGKLLLFGNGGSAADAQHIAAEFVVRYRRERRALPAIALTVDSSILTAGANDYSFDDVFARQVEALGRPGDMAIGISTSGNSRNVLNGLAAARAGGLVAAGLAGGDGGHMAEAADLLLVVPSRTVARIQEVHILLGHLLCEALDEHFAR